MLNPNKIQGTELNYSEAKKIIKNQAKLDDTTIQYFEFYKYNDELIMKLAKALI